MSIILENFANQGLITDQVDYTVDPSQITSVNNCRYKFGKLVSTLGHIKLNINFSTIPAIGTNSFILVSHFPIDNSSEKSHCFALKITQVGVNKDKLVLIKRTEGGTLVDISPTVNVFIGDDISYISPFGSSIVNPKTGVPLILDVGSSKFRPLNNWISNLTTDLFYCFKNFYICFSTLESTKKPTRIRWSHTVEQPTTSSTDPFWIDSDPKYLAGTLDLPDNIDEIQCIKELGDRLIIFTNENIYGLFFTGNSYVFGLQKIISGKGACSNYAVAEYRNSLIVVNHDDIYMFNGNQVESIISGKVKDSLLGSISNFKSIKVFKHPNDEEIFIYDTKLEAIGSKSAWVYNLIGNQWTKIDLPNPTKHIENTKIINYSTSWDSAIQVWGSTISKWSDLDKVNFENRFFYGCTNGDIFVGDFGNLFNTTPIPATFGRDRMSLSEIFKSKYPIKLVRQIIPLIRGSGKFRIKIGISQESYSPIYWIQEMEIELNGTNPFYWKVDCLASGRYLSYYMELLTEGSFIIESFELDIVPRGKR